MTQPTNTATGLKIETSLKSAPNYRRIFWVGLLILPPLYVLYIILSSVPDVPFADEWVLSPLVVNFKSGGVTLANLWAFHNEHRIVISRLVILGLTAVTGSWNIVNETLLSWFIVILTTAVAGGLIWQTVQSKTARPLLLLLASWLLFNLMQWENWIWGFQMAWFLVNLFSLLSRYPGNILAFGGALVLSWLATLTLASGFFFALPILLGFLVTRREWHWKYSLVWGIFFVGFLAIYIQGLQQTAGGGLLGAPLESLVFILAFVGAPLAADSMLLAAVLGFSGLSAAAFLTCWLWRRGQFSWQRNVPWFVLLAFTLANALVAANGRVLLDPKIALASRYISISTLFWLALAILIAQNLPLTLANLRARRTIFYGTGLLLLLVIVQLDFVGSWVGLLNINFRTGNIRAAVPFLYDYSTLHDGVAETIFTPGQTTALKGYLYALDSVKETVFRVDRATYYHNLQEKWRLALEKTPNLVTVPADRLTLAPKSAELLSLTSQPDATLEFSRTGKLATRLFLPEFASLSQKQIQANQLPILEIVTEETAWYVQLEWDDGHFPLVLPLAALANSAGKAHYYAYLPEIVIRERRTLKAAVLYKTGRETKSSFQAIIHIPN